ncbi:MULTISPECIES: DUF3050 domain-containing protein [Thioalkalivibrio]|uniref:Heme oxygenase n=1 Tax=Thioalkalivibrio halophilus TaxID=252474 RepID=A0A1V3A1K2_9GAMM|nr:MULTISPECIES: DUF3050 domain-containing protein [Thioalkalivibrio]OOC11214.1 heme oxygenase [Thioalkalivibrio halophilus]
MTANAQSFNPASPPELGLDSLAPLQRELEEHPVYALRDLRDLRGFMECHVYPVWDFMSLIKFLQQQVAPIRYPWTPGADASVCRFINELVLEEESDRIPAPDGQDLHLSHFELYCAAMEEVGADPDPARRFVALAAEQGIDAALNAGIAPAPSAEFVRRTFARIERGRSHEVAAALALGREHVIPGMFRQFLARMQIDEQNAPMFHLYLQRHIHLDEDFHGPLSLRLVEALCGDSLERLAQARDAARAAIQDRLDLWEGVRQRLGLPA